MIFKNSRSASWLVRELFSLRLDWQRVGLSANRPITLWSQWCSADFKNTIYSSDFVYYSAFVVYRI